MWNTEMVSPLFSLIWWWAFQTNVYESTFFSFSKQRRRGAEASEVLQWCWNKCQFVKIADVLKALFFNLQVMYSNFPWAKYSQKRVPISLKCFTARVIGNKFSTGKATFSFSLLSTKDEIMVTGPVEAFLTSLTVFHHVFKFMLLTIRVLAVCNPQFVWLTKTSHWLHFPRKWLWDDNQSDKCIQTWLLGLDLAPKSNNIVS